MNFTLPIKQKGKLNIGSRSRVYRSLISFLLLCKTIKYLAQNPVVKLFNTITTGFKEVESTFSFHFYWMVHIIVLNVRSLLIIL